jgi:hypothetical protein
VPIPASDSISTKIACGALPSMINTRLTPRLIASTQHADLGIIPLEITPSFTSWGTSLTLISLIRLSRLFLSAKRRLYRHNDQVIALIRPKSSPPRVGFMLYTFPSLSQRLSLLRDKACVKRRGTCVG